MVTRSKTTLILTCVVNDIYLTGATQTEQDAEAQDFIAWAEKEMAKICDEEEDRFEPRPAARSSNSSKMNIFTRTASSSNKSLFIYICNTEGGACAELLRWFALKL